MSDHKKDSNGSIPHCPGEPAGNTAADAGLCSSKTVWADQRRNLVHGRWSRRVAMTSVAVVATVAAIVSYSHMHDVAARAGEGWRSWIEPLSVDGLLVGASQVVAARRRAWLAWVAVAVGLLVSLAANLAAAGPDLMSRLVAAWPAVALALSYEALLSLTRQVPDMDQADADQPDDQLASVDDEAAGEAEDDVSLLVSAREVVEHGRRHGIRVGRGRLAQKLEITPAHARKLLDELAEKSHLHVVN